jgi:hypothetical protein
VRVAELKTLIAHVEKQGKQPLNLLVNLINGAVVDGELLKIGVQFYANKTKLSRALELKRYFVALHILVKRGKSLEIKPARRVKRKLAQEIIYGANLFGRGGDRANDAAANACLGAKLGEPGGCAVKTHWEVVKRADAFSGLFGDFVGVYVNVRINYHW